MPASAKTGRPRRYCKRSCRQRDFEARERARAHGLDEADLIVTREALEQLRDQLYVVQCAVEDVRRDIGSSARPTLHEYEEAMAWLLDSLAPLLAAPALSSQESSVPSAGGAATPCVLVSNGTTCFGDTPIIHVM
jgi:hypothetical protein